jgi:hypothetical protein
VAVAGLGFGEKVHLPALADCPATEPVALWHPRAERLEAACRKAGLPGSTDFDSLLADPGVDALVIATPPAPRFALARRALEAGKHLLLEKPVALDAFQVEELQRLALRQRLVPGRQQAACMVDLRLADTEHRVRGGDLVGVDQRLAIKPKRTALSTGGFITRRIVEVHMDAIEYKQPVGARGHDNGLQRHEHRRAISRMGAMQVFGQICCANT